MNTTMIARPTVLARRLTEARLRCGWTQRELSIAADVFEVRVGDYERGNYIPRIDALIRLADALGVSIDWLVGRTDTSTLEQTGAFTGLAGSMSLAHDPDAAHGTGEASDLLVPERDNARGLDLPGVIRTSA